MNKAIVSIDTETTGVNIAKDRIVEIACVKFDGDTTTEKCIRVNPGIPIPKEATEIHGISDADVQDKPTFKQYAKSILAFISGCDILTYNGNKFDIPLLYTEFYRAGIEWDYTAIQFVDACNIFKRKEQRDLDAAMTFYCNEKLIGGHSALVDAKATLKVFAEQLRRYDMTNTDEVARYSNFDADIIDLGGWFTSLDGKIVLAKGNSKGTQDKGFIKWMLKLDDLLPDARKICNQILTQ